MSSKHFSFGIFAVPVDKETRILRKKVLRKTLLGEFRRLYSAFSVMRNALFLLSGSIDYQSIIFAFGLKLILYLIND